MALDLVQIRALAEKKEDENSSICPIVYEVMEELKKSLGFLPTASQPPIRARKRKI